MYVYECTHVCMCKCIYVLCTYEYTYVCMYMYVLTYICIIVFTYVRMYIFIYISVRMYVYTYLSMYICIYVRMCVRTCMFVIVLLYYICINIFRRTFATHFMTAIWRHNCSSFCFLFRNSYCCRVDIIFAGKLKLTKLGCH